MKSCLRFTGFLKAGVAASLLIVATAGPVCAADYYKTAGNLAVYLGVMPAELVQGHPPEHPKGKMHGGLASNKRQNHVVVAVFDTKDGSRITNAEVSARVGQIGLAQMAKKLDPMTIANTTSFGNYFLMSGAGLYRIEIEIHRPNAEAVEATFEYVQPRT